MRAHTFGVICMNTRIALLWLSYLAVSFGLMFLSYFGESHTYSGFVKHQLIAWLGYFFSLGQMDYLLVHPAYGPHNQFQEWVLPVYLKLGLLFISVGGLINLTYAFYANRNQDI